MKIWDASSGRALVLSLDPGDDVLDAVTEACRSADFAHAYVASGIGTLDRCRLHYVATVGYPPEEYFPQWTDTPLELAGASGVVVEGVPHLHATISDRGQAWAGHLERGCRVLYLAEIVLIELRGADLHRAADERGVVRLLGHAPSADAGAAG
jgi:uncharacterized protein